MKTLVPLFFAFLVFAEMADAQDIQFSQFYRAQTYISPAFAGNAHTGRGMFHQRIQWPRLQANYLSSYLSYDTYLSKYNSGIGVNLLYDVQGGGTYRKTAFNIQYSYELTMTKEVAVRFGLQAGFGVNSLDYSDLYFPRQFDDNGLQIQDNGESGQSVLYPDLGSGIMFYSSKWWLGYSTHHINRPNMSFLDNDVPLPVKHTIVAGYRIDLQSGGHRHAPVAYSVFPVVNFKFQGKSDQFDLGLYGVLDHLLVGAWYRGIPIKKYEPTLQNNESVVALMGWRYKRVSITYSYDFVVSRLKQVKHGGAHEINITFQNKKYPTKKKLQKRIPCPKFI